MLLFEHGEGYWIHSTFSNVLLVYPCQHSRTHLETHCTSEYDKDNFRSFVEFALVDYEKVNDSENEHCQRDGCKAQLNDTE